MSTPDTKPGAYYVSVVRGSDWRPLVGPFINNHAAALDLVDAARDKAMSLDPRAVWYAFGTVRIDIEPGKAPPAGALNKFFPEEIAA